MKNTARKTVKAGKTSAPMAVKASAAAKKVDAVSNTRQPTADEIARRSYELFLARGGEHGHDVEDWLQAERELQGSRG